MKKYPNSIFADFHDMLFVFTEDGIIEDYITPNHENDLLLPTDSFLGKNHREVLPFHVSTQIDTSFKKIDQGSKLQKFDYSLEVNESTQWYSAVISRFQQDDKTRYLGTVRNITDRKNQELLLSGVLNASPGGIIVFTSVRDTDNKVVDFEITNANASAEVLTGATADQLIGQKLTASVPEQTLHSLIERFKTTVETGKQIEFTYRHTDEQNEEIWYYTKLAKYRDGVISSFMDITKQKKNEEKLARVNDKLKKLNNQKDKLFAVISHDLKNAVSGALGIYDMVLEEFETFSREELFEQLKLLNVHTINNTELLEDLLTWARSQFQEVAFNPEKLHLSDITDSVFSDVSSNAETKGIDLQNTVPDHVFVHADASMVKTVLRNLISNGIKFSHPGDSIVVHAKETGSDVEISVTDEGVGMEKETLEKVLNKFSSYTTPGTGGEKGSGLGLDLCIDFVDKSNGKIWAKSEPGKGSTFSFTLPAHPEGNKNS